MGDAGRTLEALGELLGGPAGAGDAPGGARAGAGAGAGAGPGPGAGGLRAGLGPADIGPAAGAGPGVAPVLAGAEGTLGGGGAVGRSSKAIWDPDEVPEAPGFGEAAADDGREEPAYEFRYGQAVGSQDVFLGLGEKDPSSTQCEVLILVVDLPEAEDMKGLGLDVQATTLRLESEAYRLCLPLPHEVDAARGKAAWEGKHRRLKVTLPIIRRDPWE